MSHWAPARIRIQGKDETRAWTHYPNPLLMLDSCRVTVLAAGLVVLLTHPPPWFMDDWFMGDWFMDDCMHCPCSNVPNHVPNHGCSHA